MARRPSLVIREKRLGALGAYFGSAEALADELESGAPIPRVRTFAQSTPDDIIQSLRFLSGIDGTGIVVHGALGCAGALSRTAFPAGWAVSNLDQRDTILGSDKALEQTVKALHSRYRPWAIFIVATPVVAINNDEIRFTADKMSNGLGIPVIVVGSDGFRSRIAATGFDVAADAVLPLVEPAAGTTRHGLINLLAVDDGIGVRHLCDALTEMGFDVNRLPSGGTRASFRRAAEATLSVCLQPDETAGLAGGLERHHGVPVLSLPVPIGWAASAYFLSALAEAAPQAPGEAASPPDAILDGKRVYLALPPAAALGACGLIAELGGTIAGLGVDHIDRSHLAALRSFAGDWPEAPLHVGLGQPFEQTNLLARLAPDLVIGSPGLAALAARQGFAAVSAHPADLMGEAGALRLARRMARSLANTALVKRLSARPSRYRATWLKRSPDWHIKREVK